MWAASVKMASEPDKIPPANSKPIKMKQIKDTKNNFFMALLPCAIFFLNFVSCSKAQQLLKFYIGLLWNFCFLALFLSYKTGAGFDWTFLFSGNRTSFYWGTTIEFFDLQLLDFTKSCFWEPVLDLRVNSRGLLSFRERSCASFGPLDWKVFASNPGDSGDCKCFAASLLFSAD